MELSNVTENLFENLSARKKQTVKEPNMVSNLSATPPPINRDARTLEYQLNQHLRSKYKEPTRVTLHTPQNLTLEEVSVFLQQQEKPKRSWAALPMYEKWKLVQAHTRDPALLRQYKTWLREGVLDAVYDPQTEEIRNVHRK